MKGVFRAGNVLWAVAMLTGMLAVLVWAPRARGGVKGGERRNVVDQDFGWAVPGKKAPAKATMEAKDAVQKEMALILKRHRQIMWYREKIRKLLEEKQALEQMGEGRDSERKIERIEKHIEKYEDRLGRELEKVRKSYQKTYGKLKDECDRLKEKAAQLEEKGRNADKYRKKIAELEPQLDRLDSILKAIDALGKVDVKAAPAAVKAKPGADKMRR